MILLHMGLYTAAQLYRPSFSDQLLFKKVVLKNSYVIYHFRVKNGCYYLNALVDPALHHSLFKKVGLVSLCVLVLIR